MYINFTAIPVFGFEGHFTAAVSRGPAPRWSRGWHGPAFDRSYSCTRVLQRYSWWLFFLLSSIQDRTKTGVCLLSFLRLLRLTKTVLKLKKKGLASALSASVAGSSYLSSSKVKNKDRWTTNGIDRTVSVEQTERLAASSRKAWIEREGHFPCPAQGTGLWQTFKPQMSVQSRTSKPDYTWTATSTAWEILRTRCKQPSISFSKDEALRKMKIAPLGLAGDRWYDRTIFTVLRTPTMKESQLLREKTTSSVFVSTHDVQTLCMPRLTCIHAQHQAMWRRLLAVETLPIDRWHDRTTGEDLRARSIAIEVKHETLPANRTRLLAAPVLPVDLVLACNRRRHCSPTRDGHQPVMTGHNARRPRTGRERRPWWLLSEASYLTVWTLNDRFFASLVHCMLRRVLSEYWRKETEKSKVFGGVVGLDGRCSAQAEQRKKPVAVGPPPGAYLSTETNLVPIRGVMKKEFDTGHTDTHAELKRRGPPGPRR